jgi:hypothetical protein
MVGSNYPWMEFSIQLRLAVPYRASLHGIPSNTAPLILTNYLGIHYPHLLTLAMPRNTRLWWLPCGWELFSVYAASVQACSTLGLHLICGR